MRSLIVILCGTAKNPPDVGPPCAVTRCVRVSLLVRVRVMNPMGCYPLNWTAFQRKGAAGYRKYSTTLGT